MGYTGDSVGGAQHYLKIKKCLLFLFFCIRTNHLFPAGFYECVIYHCLL